MTTACRLILAFVCTACVQAQTKLLRFPDLHGDAVVFTYGGDLWQAPLSGGNAWDVRWPSAGSSQQEWIVYEKGGELFWFDCTTRTETAISIRFPDQGLLVRRTTVDASSSIEILLEKIRTDPRPRPTAPPSPVKTGR